VVKVSASQPRDHGFKHYFHKHASSYDSSTGSRVPENIYEDNREVLLFSLTRKLLYYIRCLNEIIPGVYRGEDISHVI
jgi:hypothetical protein